MTESLDLCDSDSSAAADDIEAACDLSKANDSWMPCTNHILVPHDFSASGGNHYGAQLHFPAAEKPGAVEH